MTPTPPPAQLLDQYQPLIKATAARLYPLLDFDDAYQQAVLFFLEAIIDFDPAYHVYLPLYLKQRLSWRAFNLRRRLYPGREITGPLLPYHEPADPPTVSTIESLLDLATSLATATPTQRRCLAALIRHDFDARAAAKALDITPRSVHRIMQRLRTHLKNHSVPGDSQ